MEDIFLHKRALSLWQEGQRLHLEGDLERAMSLYSQSIAVYPTAEAHTFLGWAYSFLNRIEDAIDQCRKAIEVDPHFGSAYNDLGSYFIAQGNFPEAVKWLQRAKRAKRYEPRHYPYVNLGRIYASQGRVAKAIREFEQALTICPDDPGCLAALARLKQRIN